MVEIHNLFIPYPIALSPGKKPEEAENPIRYNPLMPAGPPGSKESFLKPLSSDLFQKTITSAKKKPEIITFDKENLSDETFDEARKFVMSTILSESPKESLVYVQDDKIILKSTGDFESCPVEKDADDIGTPGNPVIVIHSHPDYSNGAAFPVSFGDFGILQENSGIRSVYAINSLGEYSVLRKKTSEAMDFIKLMDLEDLYWSEFADYLSETGDEKCEKAAGAYYKLLDMSSFDEGKKELMDYFNGMLRKELPDYTACFIHKFWQRHAEEFGLEYETNFSTLLE